MNPQTATKSIHITDLPDDMDADKLSTIFNWSLDCIVMKPLSQNSLICRECWVIDKKNELTCSEIHELWHRTVPNKVAINCTEELLTFELCRFFRNGQCGKGDCHWEHQVCTARGSCASTCPFGHPLGSGKTGDMPTGTYMLADLYRW